MRAALDHCLEGRELTHPRRGPLAAPLSAPGAQRLMHPQIASASTSITWRRCASSATRAIRSRCRRRCWPSRPAPTTSRCTCARIAAISRSATCGCSPTCCSTRMNLEMAATAGDGRVRLRACARPIAAWCPSGAPSSPPRADWTWSAAARAARRPARGSPPRGIRVALFIDARRGADRGGGRGARAGDRAAYRGLCRQQRRGAGARARAAARCGAAGGQPRPRSACRPRAELSERRRRWRRSPRSSSSISGTRSSRARCSMDWPRRCAR